MSSRALLALSAALPGVAAAEGSAQIANQILSNEAVVYVDILDAEIETFTYTGNGTISVADPEGTSLGSFQSGDTVTPTPGVAGAYEITFLGRQEPGWDFTVNDSTDDGGRLWAYNWILDAQEYGEDGAWTGSLYILVPAGGDGYNGVVEVKSEGWAGYQWEVVANGHGIEGAEAGRSALSATNYYVPEFAVYLQNPSVATYRVKEPRAEDLSLRAGSLDCPAVAPGHLTGTFTFESGVAGTYHLGCDLDGDGAYDVSSNADVMMTGEATAGMNEVEWDGTDNTGAALAPGVYDCRVSVAVGEIHYIAADIEASYPGIRFYRLSDIGARTPLPMYWNDEAVQHNEVPMPNGEPGLVSSGAAGVDSGPYEDDPRPNENARSWGNFTEASKGNAALLDTFTWLDIASSDEFQVRVYDAEADDDNNGAADVDEVCDGLVPPTEGYYLGGCSTGGPGGGVALAMGALALGAGRRRRP